MSSLTHERSFAVVTIVVLALQELRLRVELILLLLSRRVVVLSSEEVDRIIAAAVSPDHVRWILSHVVMIPLCANC